MPLSGKRYALSRNILALGLFAATQNAFGLDFLEAYELARTNDPEVIAAAYDYQSTLEDRSISKSELLPQISIDVFAQQTKQENTSPGAIGDNDKDGYTLSVTQSIYSHDLYLKLEQTDFSIASAAATFSAAKQSLILRIASAYFDVLAATDNLAFAEAEKKAIGEQLEQTRQRFEVGLIAITDAKESQAQFDISVAQQIQAINRLATSGETLRSIIGSLPDKLDRLAEKFPLVNPEPADIEAWVSVARSNNPSLKSAEYAFDIASKQVDIEQTGHYPSLDLSLSHDDITTETNASTTESADTSLTLNLSIPIYSGGATSARAKQAVAQKERARYLKQKAQRDTIKLTRDSYLGVTTAIAQVQAFKQALISTQTAYEATQAGFEAGTRTAVDVLSALREQYRSERDYAQSRYDYILNVLRLKQAAGTLSKDDVFSVNQWLQH